MGRGTRTHTEAVGGTDIRAALRPRTGTGPSAAQVWAAQQSDPDEAGHAWAQLLWDQQRLGGKVYRASDERLDALRKKIDSLNKKAARLGGSPIELRVTGERQQEILATDAGERIADWTFVVLGQQASTEPLIPGFAMLGALDHTHDGVDGEPAVTIREVPSFALLQDLDEDQVRHLRAVDFQSYRDAENRCDHCGYKRRRNTTYLMLNKNTGQVMQVGADCMADFTGAPDPEKALRWAELLAALDADMQQEATDTTAAAATGRPAISTTEFLAHAAACVRERGWRKRWHEGQRVPGTADDAHLNMENGGIEVTDTDRKLAADALAWAREELADREGLSEFEHNLTVYAAADYLGAKGDGTLAYVVEGYTRDQQRQQAKQAASTSEYVGAVKDRIKGLKLTVDSVHPFPSDFGGMRYLTRGRDSNGNVFSFYGPNELDKGSRYSLSGTVKKHELDRRTEAKTTVLSNCRSISELAA